MSDDVRQVVIVGALVIALVVRVIVFAQYLHHAWIDAVPDVGRSRFVLFMNRVFIGETSEVVNTKAEWTGWGLDASLVAGSVALAAWTQLFAASGQFPAARISGFSMGLLFVSSAVLLAHPLLVAGSLNTISRARRLFTVVGYAALVLSMSSIAYDILGPESGGLIVGVSGSVFGLRELSVLIMVVREARTTRTSSRGANNVPEDWQRAHDAVPADGARASVGDGGIDVEAMPEIEATTPSGNDSPPEAKDAEPHAERPQGADT